MTRLRQGRDGGFGSPRRRRADGRPGGRGHRAVPGTRTPADRRADPRRHHAGSLGPVPPSGPAARRRGAGRGDRPVGRPDRRGPAPGRAAGAPVRRQRTPGGPGLPGPGRGRLAGGHGLLPQGDRASSRRGRGAVPGQPLRHRTGRRPRYRPARVRPGRDAAVRPAVRRSAAGSSTFDADLRRNLDAADATSESIKDSIDAYIAATGHRGPGRARYTPVWEPALRAARARPPRGGHHRGGVVHRVRPGPPVDRDPGLRRARLPDPPARHDQLPGLYFLGLPWQHTWGSGRLCGVGADAEYLARQIAAFGPLGRRVRWIAGTTASTYPSDDDWVAPRTVA